MSRSRLGGSAIDGHAAEQATARRLIAAPRERRARGARVLPAARALGARRGRPVHGRRRAPRRCSDAADRVETALAALERPLGRYLLELEPEQAEGRSWFGEPGQRRARRLGAGARAAPGSRPRRTASRPPTSSSRC